MGGLTVHHVTSGAGGVGATAAPSEGGSTDLWVLVLLALLGSSVIAGLITSVLGNLRAAATARREGYANAVRALIARGEYPYRVRRRVSDEPEVLAALVERGHDLQEQLAACRTWVRSEDRAVALALERALAAIDAEVGPATSDAWATAPAAGPDDMNLSGWGPGDQWPHIETLQRAIAYRFGWRRLVPTRLRWGVTSG